MLPPWKTAKDVACNYIWQALGGGITASSAAAALALPQLQLALDAAGFLRVALPAGAGRWRINGMACLPPTHPLYPEYAP